jgi:CubicO group peptidase (beta-lactamase class C family)
MVARKLGGAWRLAKLRRTRHTRAMHLPRFLVAVLLAPCVLRADSISAKMQEFVDRGVVAGAVTLVATKDGVKHLAAVGKADLATGREMKTDDMFWIASMTKPMTSTCVAMLAEEGKLSFDDPVEKHLPEFAGQWLVESREKDRLTLVRPARAITIRDLLTHTSGMGEVKSPRAHATLAELAMAYSQAPLQFPPGSKWSYSNPGMNTLGRIVEVVSGIGFAEFVQKRLLDPLAIKETTFWPTEAQAARLAKCYKTNKETGRLEEAPMIYIEGALTDRQRTPFPTGGLYSTASDVARFYRAMLNGGTLDGRTILKPETAKQITTTQTGDMKMGFAEGMSWGFGFQIVREPQGATAALSPGTFGHGGAFATQSWADPQRGLIFILMVQRSGLQPNGDSSEIRAAFQQAAVEQFAK